ncbi:hypothetical protein ACEWY4_010441 [Coilia grayii]|uniref:Myb-like domain-containing protein n=1 Tax=Coilia grayii TaxID=363190 RepID=A0ABD1K1W7_9TELE
MSERTKVRAKRSPAFTQEEMDILLDEVQKHRATLFGGTKGVKSVAAKIQRWEAIAKCMAPSGPCGLRDWQRVRKKWQEFASQTKRKEATARRAAQATGGGAPTGPDLTPDELRVLSIVGTTACEMIAGGRWTCQGTRDVSPAQEEGEDGEEEDGEQPSGSRPTAAHLTTTSRVVSDFSPPPPFPPYPTTPAGRAGVRIRGTMRGRRPTLTSCTCSERLMASEEEKLVVLRGIEAHLALCSATQQQMLELQTERIVLQREKMALRREEVALRREEMELQRWQVELAEAQFARPSISVPIILPQGSGTCHMPHSTFLCNVYHSI